MKPFSVSLVLVSLLGGSLASAQVEVRVTLGQPLSKFGTSLANVGDWNGDGLADLAVGAPGGVPDGYVQVLSSTDGNVIVTIPAPNAWYFGTKVAGGGDVNSFGTAPDLAVGTPQENGGVVRVYANPNGALLRTLTADDLDDEFGRSIAFIPDINGDFRDEILVGAPNDENPNLGGTQTGAAYLFSGIDGSLLSSFYGAAIAGDFGRAVAHAGDVNNDGTADWIIGDPFDALATVYSGADDSVIWTFEGISHLHAWGGSVAGGQDVDDDGHDDLLVGAPGLGVSGTVMLFSGIDGSLIRSVVGIDQDRAFGSRLAFVPDTDGDGVEDYIVGDPAADLPFDNSGCATIVSGADGSFLHRSYGRFFDQLGYSVTGIGDIDGDGLEDVALGEPVFPFPGTSSFAGAVRWLIGLGSGQFAEPFCEGSSAVCPCGNGGLAGHGCDTPQGTGGVKLTLAEFGTGGAEVPWRARFVSTGFPSMGQPAALLVRAETAGVIPTPFGDGVTCLAQNTLVRLGVTQAVGGVGEHVTANNFLTGNWHYQVWYRSQPMSFCVPTAAFNMSSGLHVAWP